MYKDELYIAPEYKLRDYLGLNLEMNSSPITWKRAIGIFSNRMYGRYFNAIQKLADTDDINEMRKYGFSIMCIECLLIDTFVKFRYGPNRVNYNGRYDTKIVKDTYQNKSYIKLIYFKENKRRFTKFLRDFILFDPNQKAIAEKFYDDIRCSVVHFGSTENTSRLTCDSSKLITVLDNGDISVDVYKMYLQLQEYLKNYIEELTDRSHYELRKNFLLTMDYLCGIYEQNF